jgi:hypothetical protein
MTNKKSKILNIEQAISRMEWRMKNEKFAPNETDQQATEFLSNWINQQKQKALSENLLFAKVFAYALKNELIFYRDIQFASRKLQEQLELPIEFHYDKIHEYLNMIELDRYSNQSGLINKHPAFRTDEENNKNNEIIKTKESEFKIYTLGKWKIDQVYRSLNNTITECINRYKNKL